MSDSRTTVSELRRIVRRFIEERDWMQFHSPKNIAMSIAIEAAELMEHFQWTFAAKPEEKHLGMDRTKIEDEIADIAVYVLDFCEVMGIDLSGAVRRKMIQNRKKYPAAQVRERLTNTRIIKHCPVKKNPRSRGKRSGPPSAAPAE